MSTIRQCIVPAALLALAGIANAAPPQTALPPLPSDAPQRCVAMLHWGPSISGRISAANCLAEARMNALQLGPNQQSANALAAATAPSIQQLDSVIALGNPYWTIVAEDAKRDAFQSMAVRLRATVPPENTAASQQVESLVASWNSSADGSTARIADLATTHPEVAARDQVIDGIAARAKTAEAQVASRRRAGNRG